MNFIKFRKVGNDEQCIFSVFQKDIKQINRFTGGVLNVQSDLSVFQNETTTSLSSLQNSNVMKHGAVKSVQRGTSKYQSSVSSDKVIISVPINYVDINKALVIAYPAEYITKKGDISDGSGRIVLNNITLSSNKIDFDVLNPTGNWVTPMVIWQVIEFY